MYKHDHHALHLEASPWCILLLLYNYVLATLLILNSGKGAEWIMPALPCFLCRRAMLARHGQMLVTGVLFSSLRQSLFHLCYHASDTAFNLSAKAACCAYDAVWDTETSLLS